MFALAAEQVLGATAALATALLYPAVALGIPFVVPRPWLRAEPRPWMDRDNTGDHDTSSRDGGDTAG